jgi:hypothetical protein
MTCGNPTDSVFLMSVPANVARTGAKADEAGIEFLDGSWRRKWLSGIPDIILGDPAAGHTHGILQLDGPPQNARGGPTQ